MNVCSNFPPGKKEKKKLKCKYLLKVNSEYVKENNGMITAKLKDMD